MPSSHQHLGALDRSSLICRSGAGHAWLRRLTECQGQRMILKQHREVLIQPGWVALLLACVNYDTGDRQAAETMR